MDDTEPIMIASAVVVPGQDISPERLKRRQESETPEISKRQRLDDNGRRDEPTAIVADKRGDAAAAAAAAAAVDSRENRRRTGMEEEKRRGKRLFGALLGTIGKFQKETTSQRARSSAVKRREVEAKLQEKLKAQTEELDERKKREDDDFNLRRRVEARNFEERAMRIRHSSLTAQANMLATRTIPKLFYLPWKLLPSEEDTIRAQVETVEENIRNAEDVFQRLRERDEAELQAATGEGGGGGGGGGGTAVEATHQEDYQLDISIHTPPHEDVADPVDNREFAEEKHVQSDEHRDNADTHLTQLGDRGALGGGRRNSDIGDAVDIVDEGGEDTVIY